MGINVYFLLIVKSILDGFMFPEGVDLVDGFHIVPDVLSFAFGDEVGTRGFMLGLGIPPIEESQLPCLTELALTGVLLI